MSVGGPGLRRRVPPPPAGPTSGDRDGGGRGGGRGGGAVRAPGERHRRSTVRSRWRRAGPGLVAHDRGARTTRSRPAASRSRLPGGARHRPRPAIAPGRRVPGHAPKGRGGEGRTRRRRHRRSRRPVRNGRGAARMCGPGGARPCRRARLDRPAVSLRPPAPVVTIRPSASMTTGHELRRARIPADTPGGVKNPAPPSRCSPRRTPTPARATGGGGTRTGTEPSPAGGRPRCPGERYVLGDRAHSMDGGPGRPRSHSTARRTPALRRCTPRPHRRTEASSVRLGTEGGPAPNSRALA